MGFGASCEYSADDFNLGESALAGGLAESSFSSGLGEVACLSDCVLLWAGGASLFSRSFFPNKKLMMGSEG